MSLVIVAICGICAILFILVVVAIFGGVFYFMYRKRTQVVLDERHEKHQQKFDDDEIVQPPLDKPGDDEPEVEETL